MDWVERPFARVTNHGFVDLSIHFIGASGLPKMDVIGSADPYFVAKLDSALTFVSTVKSNTLAPVWNEYWRIRNVPVGAKLRIEVMDKDNGTVTDDFIGEVETNIKAGARELTLEASGFRSISRGTMWIKIDSTPATDPKADKRQYTFDGPIRYSRHFAPTVGLLGNVQDAHLYSTWKMFLRGVPLFFGDTVQHWNTNYKAAQAIFSNTTSVAVRSTIQAGHRMLYARSTTNTFGVINSTRDIVDILHGGKAGSTTAHRVKPAVYTYIISAEDDSFRFSETGAAFFVDFASKHALHANCAEVVRYSGEFHPRPEGGWENFSDETPDEEVKWELVLDNNSGTYAPDPMMLAELKELFEYNFPEFKIYTFDFNDPRLSQSREACRAYALAHRGINQDELQPHSHVPGEETLSHQASVSNHPDESVQPYPHPEDTSLAHQTAPV
ncbi:hypothetical protein BXZ70DRAFT_1000487 [Cristinia sonorae]|uniref:C2 domain-containing protein n=1 Tax=Cristinia sonorae TaxID=1940300 RepID=A0A8K0XPU1_9AGAR|nr:hypothetical protein BXZ70DRAFT_1000487 [Cristinia sonorae]